MTSQHVYNNKAGDEVEWRDYCCSCNQLQYTDTEKCNRFVLYNKSSNDLFEGFLGQEKRKNKSADVDLTPSVCVL